MSDWFIFRNNFPIGSLVSLWSHGFTFQRRKPKQLLSNSNAGNTCENKKKRQSVPVLK